MDLGDYEAHKQRLEEEEKKLEEELAELET